MMNSFSVVISGLGGQGILLLSKAIANAASSAYSHVSRTESRGLSQRGGSVQSAVRFGMRPTTAVIDEGNADLVVSLELLEAARSMCWLSESGILVGNTRLTPPLSLTSTWHENAVSNETQLREQLLDYVQSRSGAYAIDATKIAERLHAPRVFNAALLGAASHFLPLETRNLKCALLSALKNEVWAANAAAFEIGRSEMYVHLPQKALRESA